jgi:hypothetical protein
MFASCSMSTNAVSDMRAVIPVRQTTTHPRRSLKSFRLSTHISLFNVLESTLPVPQQCCLLIELVCILVAFALFALSLHIYIGTACRSSPQDARMHVGTILLGVRVVQRSVPGSCLPYASERVQRDIRHQRRPEANPTRKSKLQTD